MVELLAEHCSAVLVDVDLAGTIGTQWHLPDGVGLIVGLAELDYDGVTCPPPGISSPELLRKVHLTGASAAKVVLYSTPMPPTQL